MKFLTIKDFLSSTSPNELRIKNRFISNNLERFIVLFKVVNSPSRSDGKQYSRLSTPTRSLRLAVPSVTMMAESVTYADR